MLFVYHCYLVTGVVKDVIHRGQGREYANAKPVTLKSGFIRSLHLSFYCL